jgi:hypothetical protein
MRKWLIGIAWAAFIGCGSPAFGQDMVLATNVAGLTIGGAKPTWTTGFGNVNGLGIGTPQVGATMLQPAGGTGVLYTTPYNIVISGANNGNRALVRAYVSTNFVHPSIIQVYHCVASCAAAANYVAMSTNLAAQSDVISPGLASNQTVTRYLAVFVSNQNGAAAFTGIDTAAVTFNIYRENSGVLQHTYTLNLNNPNENVQTALRLQLSTAPGGRTIAAGTDYSLGYGTVNGLGIGPGLGLTATATAGGYNYSTPYLLTPAFSSFGSVSGTLKAYVSTDFAHPSQLELRDSSNGAAFAAISKSAVAQTVLTSPASGATVTRHLGLFVSNANGAGVFTGNDSATVTFTLVVP